MADSPNPNDTVIDDTTTDAITYSGDWSKDTDAVFYGGSQHSTRNISASVSFRFTGERFWYYSETNSGHGDCSVTLDGVIIQSSLSTYSPAIQYTQAVYSHAVEPGPHTVVITNINDQKVLAVDYFVFRPVSNEVPNSQDISLRPDDLLVTYMPVSGAWSPIGGSTPGYRETGQQGAYFSLAFEGEYVWFQWTRNTNHGIFSVSVDGAPPANFSSDSPERSPVVILFSRALDPGHHTVTFTNVQDGDRRLGVINLVYRPIRQVASKSENQTKSTLSPTSSGSLVSSSTSFSVNSSSTEMSVTSTPAPMSTRPSPPASSHVSSPVSNGAVPYSTIIGAVLGGVACMSLVILAIILIKVRNSRRNATARSNGATTTGMQNVDAPSVDSMTVDHSMSHVSPWSYNGDDRAQQPSPEGLPGYSERDPTNHGTSFSSHADDTAEASITKFRFKN